MKVLRKKKYEDKSLSGFVCDVHLDKSEIGHLFAKIFPIFLVFLIASSFFRSISLQIHVAILISLVLSLFLAIFLYFLSVMSDKTQIYRKGLVAYDVSGYRRTSMGWANMHKVREESTLGIQAIVIKGKDGQVIKMMKNIKNKEKVALTM
ncbi:hypothetical protein SAMN02745216_05313 [Desulfatibacillum alkenivorans DSM 16219]|jgi:hypothetical protein|uniref:PH domain-containing protein n=1 Tax=Desulfatibacillum alkenivorans DSM 16219 TaxID=1121393 RepID=A0A1M7BH80_9BACT|nr:hypothetical protein [Desulfatibacillum alkenivorans]SHL54375.1 hypothetical protein SAMN02745216_05313 [Desulfatibacillum alkenivorans DSM 16219]